MATPKHSFALPKEQWVKRSLVGGALIVGVLAIAGPTGVFAWQENTRLLHQRQGEIAILAAERDALKNRVDLIDLAHADKDLVGEELRRNFNVVHPDEVVLILPKIED